MATWSEAAPPKTLSASHKERWRLAFVNETRRRAAVAPRRRRSAVRPRRGRGAAEKTEVVTNCDHLARLKFSRQLPWAFTEHGAIMAATVLKSPEAVSMSVYVVRAFVQLREHIAANAAILKRLAEIDQTLLKHDKALQIIWAQLQPLLQPPPALPRKRMGFHP